MLTIKNFDVIIKEATLSSGVPVLLFQKKGMPIHIELLLASGSRFDPIGKEGLAHFVEHMIVAGSNKFPSKDKLATYIEQLGGIFRAGTSADTMSLKVEVAEKADFAKSVLLLKEAFTEALFDDKVIENERGSIFKEMGDKLSNPSKHIWDLYSELFFQDTEVGKSILGTEESVSTISKEDLHGYYQNMLVSGRAIVAVCGDIEIGQVVSELETGLPLRISKKYYFGESLPVVRNRSMLTHRYKDQKQVHIIIGFRTTGIKNQKTIPLNIISTIFGGGRASALSRKLRYEKGLVYSVGTYSHHLSNGGAWVVKTSTSKDKLQEVVDIITKEFSRIESGGVTKEELEFAKAKIIKSSRRQMQTSASWVDGHIRKELVGNSMRLPEYLNMINSTKKSDLADIGREYFKPGAWYLAMCGDVDETSVIVNY